MKDKVRYLLLMIAATITVVACSGYEDGVDSPSSEQVSQDVVFNAYINRPSTRSGATGALTLTGAAGTTSLQTKGFGVLAYGTGEQFYSQLAIPDFMYNEHVVWQEVPAPASWTYSPIKYWPNGEGEATGVSGLLPSYVSFFAYAPWVKVDEATGLVAEGGDTDEYSDCTGITALTRHAMNGDPLVRYDVSFDPLKRVDLCWAKPRLNQTKPTGTATDDDSKVEMQFKHALAALNVQIDADVDVNAHPGGELDSDTRIYVRSITFRGFAERGQLNLNNTLDIPRWNNLDCDCDVSSQPITIYDGRRDDREGIAESLNELRRGLNPNLIQSGVYHLKSDLSGLEPPTLPFDPLDPYAPSGVTNTPVNLFGDGKASATDPIYVIPTNEPLVVTIVYDVETYDAKLISQFLSDGQTHGSTIENNITATTALRLSAGKTYTLNLHLGMNSVKVNAQVTEWEEGGSANVNVPD